MDTMMKKTKKSHGKYIKKDGYFLIFKLNNKKKNAKTN